MRKDVANVLGAVSDRYSTKSVLADFTTTFRHRETSRVVPVAANV